MDIRVLRYFLAVAREENITRAAEVLHIAQPTLSKQLMELEQELGKKLLIRGKRKITLTQDGVLLRKRAEEIVALLEKTRSESASDSREISGEISIGGNPTTTILNAASALRKMHADIRFHFFSGDATAVIERLDHGSLDFAVLLPPIDTITKEILCTVPLVLRQRIGLQQKIALWAETDLEQLNIAATYNVVHGNAISFAKSGLGYVITPRDLYAPELDSSCCFRPLEPPLQLQYALVWKRHPIFGRAAEAFLNQVNKGESDDT